MQTIEERNLGRLERSTLPKEFVIRHKGEWDHQAWLDFCASIEEKGFTPINLDNVGLILEHLKTLYWQDKDAFCR